jgi:hypothetical protein
VIPQISQPDIPNAFTHLSSLLGGDHAPLNDRNQRITNGTGNGRALSAPTVGKWGTCAGLGPRRSSLRGFWFEGAPTAISVAGGL